jgi:hypothetical protein
MHSLLVGGWRDPSRDAAAHYCHLLLPGGQLFSGAVPLLCKTWQRLNKLTIFNSCCLVANYSQVIVVPLLCETLAATQ